MSTRTQNLGLFKYDTVNDSELPFDLNVALNDNWDILDNLGSGKNIGEIVTSTIPLTDAGLHLLDGTLIQGGGIYSDFVDYIASIYDATANYFCTEQEWQQSITQYGVCGKFVYDSTNNTVRLPKYSNKIYTSNISSTAPVVDLGSNPEKLFRRVSDPTNTVNLTLYGSNIGGAQSVAGSSGSSSGNYVLESNMVADLANITTSLDGYYYIVIATSTKTDIQVDIDEIATDLNNKIDKSDLVEIQCVVETYQNGSSWYRVWSDGWCEQGGTLAASTASSAEISLLKNYSTTDYSVNVYSRGNTGDTGGYAYSPCEVDGQNTYIYGQSVSGFRISKDTSSIMITWNACGYIEV